jgi:hypothetical protein
MGFLKSLFSSEQESAQPEYDPTPEEMGEPSDDAVPGTKEYTLLQAKLFIRTVNTSRVYVDANFLSIFDREVISYAVNVARKAMREEAPTTEWNRFYNKGKYFAILEYLKETA